MLVLCTLFLQSLKELGLRLLLIILITCDSFFPVFFSISSKVILSAHAAQIIQLSLYVFGSGFFTTDQLEDSVQDAIDLGVYVVAAAGNDGESDDGDVESPGSVEDVICVGAVTRTSSIWSGSSEGDNNGRLWPNPILPRQDPDKKPEVVAPGHEVPILMARSTGSGTWWGWSSGTSAATAWVSGSIAIFLEANPEMKRDGAQGGVSAISNLKMIMSQNSEMKNGQDDHDDHYGYGLLRIDLLINETQNSSSDSSLLGPGFSKLEDIQGKYADIQNLGKAGAGTITAGAFLKEFVGDTPWCHLDIAGTAWGPKEPSYQPKVGATGVAVRMIYNLLEN